MHRHLRSVFALAVCAGAVAAQQVPEILYYKLNDGGGTLALNEASPGAGFTQAVVNGAFTFGPGQLGGGLVGTGQTGANAYVDTGYTLNLQGTSWTLEFWYTPSSYPSLQYLMGVPVGGSFRVYGAGQGGAITLTGSGLGTVSASGAMPPIGTWVHIAYVFDATTTPPRVTPYVNGAPLAPVNQTGTLTLNTGAFRLGSQITGSAGLAGTIDEFRLWGHARTATDIATNYNVELSNFNKLVATSSGGGIGDLFVSLTDLSPGATEGFTFITGSTPLSIGTGPFLGIWPDGLTWPILTVPAGPGNPLHFLIGFPGLYPDAPLSLPAGSLSIFAGQTFDFVAAVFGPGATFLGRSNVQRVAW